MEVIEIKPESKLEPAQKIYSRFDTIRDILRNDFRGYHVEHLGKGYYKIDFPAITCTGSDITQYFSIPFFHKLHRFEVKHTDSSNVDSVNALTYSLKYGSTVVPSLLFAIITNTGTVISDTAHRFDHFWRSLSRYQLITNTTNTELLYVSILVEIEDIPEKGD